MRAEHKPDRKCTISIKHARFLHHPSSTWPQYFCDWQNCYITQWEQQCSPTGLVVVACVRRRRPVLGRNLLCYDKLETYFSILSIFACFTGINLKLFGSPILKSVCKVQHDLYGANAFWTAMSPQCATFIESWCGSSQTPKYTILAWKQGRCQMGVKVSKAASVN